MYDKIKQESFVLVSKQGRLDFPSLDSLNHYVSDFCQSVGKRVEDFDYEIYRVVIYQKSED